MPKPASKRVSGSGPPAKIGKSAKPSKLSKASPAVSIASKSRSKPAFHGSRPLGKKTKLEESDDESTQETEVDVKSESDDEQEWEDDACADAEAVGMSESEGEEEDEEEEGDEGGDEDEDAEEGGEDGEGDGQEGPPTKKAKVKNPDDPSSKKARRELKRERQAHKLLARAKTTKTVPTPANKVARPALTIETIDRAKKLWEDVRRRSQEEKDRKSGRMPAAGPGSKREKVDELWAVVKGYVPELATSHATSRIIQSLLKHGTKDIRLAIGEELKGKYVELAKTPYGKFLVIKVAAYCPSVRPCILSSFIAPPSLLPRLLRHSHASHAVEEVYSKYLTAAQRDQVLSCFYGSDWHAGQKLESTVSGGWKEGSSKGPGDLLRVLQENPTKRAGILAAIRGHVEQMLAKSLTLTDLSVLHRLIADYMRCAGIDFSTTTPKIAPDAATLASLQDLVVLLTPHVLHILHTSHGSLAARLCLAYGNAKHRRAILKSLKGYVGRAAVDRHGYEVLVQACECVDDTVAVIKSMFGEIEGIKDKDDGSKPKKMAKEGEEEAEEGILHGTTLPTVPSDPVALSDGSRLTRVSDLARDPQGASLLLAVLAPRNPRATDPALLASLKMLDSVRAITSKKEDGARRTEIVKGVADWLVDGLVAGGAANLNKVVRTKGGKAVVVELLRHKDVTVDKLPLLRIAALLAFSPPPSDIPAAATDPTADLTTDLKTHPLLHRISQFLFKDLVSSSPLPGMPPDSDETFPRLLLQSLSPHLPAWLSLCASDPRATSGAAFVILSLVECKDAAVVREFKEAAGNLKEVRRAVDEWRKSQGDGQVGNGEVKEVGKESKKRKKGKGAAGAGGGMEQKQRGVTGVELILKKL